MREWPFVLVLALVAVLSVVGYFALQVLASLVSFFAYGSGEMFAAKSENVNALFLVLQLLIVSYLFYRKVWLKKTLVFLLALLIPVGLFLVLEGYRSLPD